jgi:hypothetical protein
VFEAYFIYLKSIGIMGVPILRLKKFSHIYLACLVYLVSLPVFVPADIFAYQKTFAWDANGEPDLEGYILYGRVGDPCPPYNYIDTYPEEELANPLMPMARVTDLENNTRYYFALTAYDTDGYESGYSNIIYLYNGQWGHASCSGGGGSGGVSGGGGGGGG